jgi:hypothetical protein
VAANSRAYRTRTCAGVLAATAAIGACRSHQPPIPPSIDLVAELPRAERRAAGDIDAAIRPDVVGVGSNSRLAIVMHAPARVIWSLRLPARPHILTAVAIAPEPDGSLGSGVTARMGISDGRTYDQPFLLKLTPDPSGAVVWQNVDIDLHEYAGWQWSFFYRPSETTWRINFSADLSPGGTLAWARPSIDGK